MNTHLIKKTLTLAAATSAAAIATDALASTPYNDILVQAPTLEKPQRGSVAGSLARQDYGPADLLRGTYQLPSALDAPSARGSLLAGVFPTYSPEGGISEWGMGWQTELAIVRHRTVGDLDYATDSFRSPWGRLVHGDDGAWYPAGLQQRIRLQQVGDHWTALTPAGVALTFAQRVDTDAGTYAWYLTRVTSIHGDATELVYETNASGRPFVSRVVYGSAAQPDAYELRMDYEDLDVPFVSYVSGSALVLDRRVTRVTTRVRHAASGSYVERWHHDLSYVDSPFAPTFYLHSTQKTYRSGESEPAVTYRYDLGESHLADASFEHLDELDDYLSQVGSSGLQPDHVTMLDLERDGRLDLEHQYAQTLVAQTDWGWEYQPLPADSNADSRCRPSPSVYNHPRSLARITPTEAEPQAFHTAHDPIGNTTELLVCTRTGTPLFQDVLDGHWELGPNTRLVDVNRDVKPDLVHVGSGFYQIAENVTDDAIGFVVHPPRPLTPALDPTGAWIRDMNGDGMADLVARHDGGVVVWYGKGNLQFESTGVPLEFWMSGGGRLTQISDLGFTLVQANKDGLTDVLFSQANHVYLFMNNGASFIEQPVPGLSTVSFDMSNPLVADLSGRGNLEVVYTHKKKAYALSLNSPSTGLLASVDDGKGTVMRFDYMRAPAWAGVGYRPSVLAGLTIASSGYGTVSHEYEYENPTMHTNARFLVGYEVTRKVTPWGSEEVRFHNDDRVAGIVTETLGTDLSSPQLQQVTTVEYQHTTFHGVPVFLERNSLRGWRNTETGEQVQRETETVTYEGLCPTVFRSASRHGVLTHRRELAQPAELEGALHCVPASEQYTGTHGDPALNFDMKAELTRDASGQIVEVREDGSAGSRLSQRVTYDELGHITRLERPGHGATEVAYDPTTGMVSEVIRPDGVATRVTEFDPVTDAFRALAEFRGDGSVHTTLSEFDGLERLDAVWRNLGGSSATKPAEELDYVWPTADTPGSIVTRTLVDAASNSSRENAELLTAAGDAVGAAVRTPSGWSFSRLTERNRADLIERQWRRAPVPATVAPHQLGWGLLFDGSVLSESGSNGFGQTLETSATLQEDVERDRSFETRVDDGALVTTAVENDTWLTREAQDAAGNVLWRRNELGQVTDYTYDALDRLVGIRLADGTEHHIRYDDYGQPVTVERDGAGRIEYDYDAYGRLSSRRWIGNDGDMVRSERLSYDSAGRITTRSMKRVSDGQTRELSYAYDGQGTGQPGQLGFLSKVTGAHWSKQWTYAADGTLTSDRIELADWMTVDHTFAWGSDGSPLAMTRTIRRIDGSVVDTLTREMSYDAFGRLAVLRVNGNAFTLHYDAEGRIEHIELPDGQMVAYSYDSVTGAQDGILHAGDGWDSGVKWKLNERGFVSTEWMTQGDTSSQQTYEYDARGYLVSSTTAAGASAYTYDDTGRPTHVSDVAGQRTLAAYQFDSLGRAVQKGNLQLAYGADGYLSKARRGDDVWTFDYDEQGQRILKWENGTIDAAFVDGGVLTEDGLTEMVSIAGHVVALRKGSELKLVATDARGTVIATAGGTQAPSTPYGVRASHPDDHDVLDYVQHGYDRDLGMVRLGVRDYDPEISQFVTPDPMLLENPGLCADSPTDCNLYSYARNNPLNYIDPAGTYPKTISGWLDYMTRYAEGRYYGRTWSKKAIQRHKLYQEANASLYSAKKPHDACIVAVRGGQRAARKDPKFHFSMSDIKTGMAQLTSRGLASRPAVIYFKAVNGKINKSGSRKPTTLQRSAWDEILKMAGNEPGYSMFALGIEDGNHAVSLVLDNTDPDNPRVFWSDQTGTPDGWREMTKTSLDRKITSWAQWLWGEYSQGHKPDNVIRINRIYEKRQPTP